jgi:hypothetical protein
MGPDTEQPVVKRGSARDPSRMTGRGVGDDYNNAFEMRTTAGPWRVLQWVLSGGPYTV